MASQARKRRKRRDSDYRPPPKRGQVQAREEGAAPVRPRAPGARRKGNERPPAPWGSFPLVELVVLVALVMLIGGFFVQGTRGITMIGAGVALGSLAGLELSIREHFTGYKSHTSVLAGAVTVVALAIGFFVVGWPQGIALAVAVAVFVAAFYLFREAFKRRSGGLGFR